MTTISTTKSAPAKEMSEACAAFLQSLNTDQRGMATVGYLELERFYWYYPPGNRRGLALRDMDDDQRGLAFAIIASGLAQRSYGHTRQIIALEALLGELEKEWGTVTFERDPELYYFTVFGDPSGDDPWGWRVEGHHVSLHFSIWGDEVIAVTPLFLGSNPAEVRQGPQKGLRILGDREDMAFGLMESLDAGQRSKAILFDKAQYDILTYNSTKASLPPEEGLPASRMSGTQRETLLALVTEYVGQVRTELSQQKLAAMREEGIDGLHLAWGGPVDRSKGHYYRIHGGNFVVEFMNQQNEANHIHSVWRDVENDFAYDVMREHLLLYHVL